jgi:hypothetical protein
MNKVIKEKTISSNSLVTKNFEDFHYFDSYSVMIKTEKSVDEITNQIFESPKWVDNLMSIRNKIVGVFGLKTDDAKSQKLKIEYYNIGEQSGIFDIVDRNENEIVMGKNDKHLNFQTSVFLEKVEGQTKVTMVTLVKYNNFGGKFYFFFVKPFHKLIIRSLMGKMGNELTMNTQNS